jgi:transcriptional regulator with XRE-family HTH domain
MNPEQAEKIRLKRGLDRGTKLRIIRVRRGMSQSELSEATGIPLKSIQRYEQVAKKVDAARLDTLCTLSEVLDCKITDIIEDEKLIERFNGAK